MEGGELQGCRLCKEMGNGLRRASSNAANISCVDYELKDTLKWCFLDHDSVWFLGTVCILWCGQQGMSHRNKQPCSAGGMYMSLRNVWTILVSIPIRICRELDITHTYTNIRLHTCAFSETTWWGGSGLNILPIHLICQCQGTGGMRDTLCLGLMLGRSCWHETLTLTDDPIQPVQLTAIVELCPTIVNQFVELCPSLWKASLVALQEFKAQTRFSLLSGMHKELLKILKTCWHLHLEGSTAVLLERCWSSVCPRSGRRALTFGSNMTLKEEYYQWGCQWLDGGCVSSSLCHRPWSPAGNSRTVFFFQFCGCKTEHQK